MGHGAAQHQGSQHPAQLMSTPGLDLDDLRKLLEINGIHINGPLVAKALPGGRSNLTYQVRDDTAAWVVRRPPLSGLTPSAHDMAREYRVTSALRHSAVPVAATVALDEDGSVMGAPVSVVEYVPGAVVRSRDELAALTDDQVDAVCETLVRCLVALHHIDPTDVGLGSFGRPDGFVARQVALWTRQWQRVKTQEVPDIDLLATQLADRVPATSGSSIVHGDFRIDNAILDLSDNSVRAVVDWEMATLGDPLTDAALMCVYRHPSFDAVLGIDAAWTSPRLPDADTLAEQYAHASGNSLGDWDFYLALAYFKLAVIAEGIAYRAQTAGKPDEHAHVATATPQLVSEGLHQLRGRHTYAS